MGVWGSSLTNVTIPNSVTFIGYWAFLGCTSLNSVTIPSSVTYLGYAAFADCAGLTGAYLQGNAPSVDSDVFLNATNVTVYYLPETTGWGTTFAGRPAVLWNPLINTADLTFGVRTNRFGSPSREPATWSSSWKPARTSPIRLGP
jgi:BspA type Leucine rich repeat region (6 copies)